jgi:Adenine specific DNA methylase Mod
MQKLDAQSSESQSVNTIQSNIAAIRQLFPGVFSEGRIDFDVLKEQLGEWVDEHEEKFALTWHGKRKARRYALTPSAGTLRPCKEEGNSHDWDNSRNIVIEGDNLEVLKLLRKSYHTKIKLIYIDPPYNTGNDFIYPDNFTETLSTYLQYTGQVDSQGKKFLANTETSGRFHSKWMSMMYPRLLVARDLLKDDGIIMISIDDNELTHLRKMCDEIFGEEQFLGQIIVQSNKRGQTYKQISKTHEYLVVYSNDEGSELNELEKEADSLPYKDSIGPFDLWELRNRNPKFGRFNRPNLFYPIYVLPSSLDENGYSRVSLESKANSIEVFPLNSEGEEGCWRWGKDKIRGYDLNENSPVLVGKQRRDGHWNIYEKSRKDTTKAKSIWADTEVISEQGTVEVGRIGMGDVFSHPKPEALIKRCIYLGTSGDDIILDFFAGSGTTGQAVVAQNAADGGNRKYILVQLPEPLDPSIQKEKRPLSFVTK